MYEIFSHQFLEKKLWKIFNLKPSKEIGILKEAVKEAILEGKIPNEYQSALDFILKKATQMGLNNNK